MKTYKTSAGKTVSAESLYRAMEIAAEFGMGEIIGVKAFALDFTPRSGDNWCVYDNETGKVLTGSLAEIVTIVATTPRGQQRYTPRYNPRIGKKSSKCWRDLTPIARLEYLDALLQAKRYYEKKF